MGGDPQIRPRIVSPVEPGMMVKKCRICFQAEKIPVRRGSAGVLRKGKERPQVSLVEHLRGWWGRDDAAAEVGKDAGTDDDGFISPCRCSGSMAWVHKSCLRLWRNRSPRRDSFYQCEQCFTTYRFRQTVLSRLLSNWLTIKVLTMVTVALSFLTSYLFVAGLIPNDPYPYAAPDWTSYGAVVRTEGWGGAVVPRREGIFSLDGTYVGHFDQYHMPAPTRGRWGGKPGGGATKTVPRTASPRDTVKRSGGRPRDRTGRRHSWISYLNIGCWLSGHSLDEQEDDRNDFLAAIMDLYQLKLWIAAFILLSIIAYVREGTQLACVMATFLLVVSLAWLVNGWDVMIWATPMPACIGFWKYIMGTEEAVEVIIDTIVKMTAYDLEDYAAT